jgi:hypothetical protein
MDYDPAINLKNISYLSVMEIIDTPETLDNITSKID